MGKSYAFKTRYYVLFYEAMRNGLGVTKMCQELGINRQSFNNWRKKKATVRFALKRGKAAKDNAVGKNLIDFRDYVYGRLPRDLQRIWEDLDLDKPPAQQLRPNRVRKTVEPLSTKEKQILFVHAYVESDFNAAAASRTTMISYSLYEKWKRTDKKFVRLLESVHQMMKDYIQGALHRKIKEGDINAVLFASRTLNRDRGYDPKSTVVHEHQHGGGNRAQTHADVGHCHQRFTRRYQTRSSRNSSTTQRKDVRRIHGVTGTRRGRGLRGD